MDNPEAQELRRQAGLERAARRKSSEVAHQPCSRGGVTETGEFVQDRHAAFP